jgi:hypothetical protein
VRKDAATTMSGSALIQREIMPRMTTESSTSITRSGSGCTGLGATGLVNATLINSPTKLNSPGTIEDTLQRYHRGS